MREKQSISEFIKKANNKHNHKYDYSLVEYTNNKSKINIICPTHGRFEQVLTNHLSGKGCPQCNYGVKLDILNFIDKATDKHNNKYDYSESLYKNGKSKIIIKCLLHGSFKQTPNSHLNGRGCPICANEVRNDDKRLSLSEFILKAKTKHGDKYNYSKTNYVNLDIKVDIECPIHGIYKQRPKNHLFQGNGCPRCKESIGEKLIIKFLTENKIDYERQKTYPDCKHKNPLPFDFYLPSYNMCIEYQGEQHYKPIKHFGGETAFTLRVLRDAIKEKYCRVNNINLLKVSYLDDIKSTLEKTLC